MVQKMDDVSAAMTQQNANNPVKVAAFTGRLDDPSSFFRMRQHFLKLNTLGFDIQEFAHPCFRGCWHQGPLKVIPYIPKIVESHSSDLTWLNRTLVVGLETIELLLKRPRVMDVDDAVWLNKPLGSCVIPHLARRMDAILAGNSFIADWFSRYCRRVYIVPTAIDITRYVVKKYEENTNVFTIGWTGTSGNYPYMAAIERPLARFLADHKDACLKIVAEKRWTPASIPPNRIIFVPWSRDVEVAALHDMSVGIMPLIDTPWTRGKCSFKMLQYMAVGLPVVVSPVGMNVEVLNKGKIGLAADSEDDWYQALETLYKHEMLQREFGQAGRGVVEQYYSTDLVAQELARILLQAAGRSTSPA
jgi:glycosyltransferase involved in cell wall biosynthesis